MPECLMDLYVREVGTDGVNMLAKAGEATLVLPTVSNAVVCVAEQGNKVMPKYDLFVKGTAQFVEAYLGHIGPDT